MVALASHAIYLLTTTRNSPSAIMGIRLNVRNQEQPKTKDTSYIWFAAEKKIRHEVFTVSRIFRQKHFDIPVNSAICFPDSDCVKMEASSTPKHL